MTWAIFNDAHLAAIGEILTTGSETLVAVLGGSLLEEAVERTLVERLRNDPKVIEDQFKPDMPLGAIGPQIELLYLLNAIDRPTRDTLKGIARIRNVFAHNLGASFASEDTLKYVGKLAIHKGRTYYPNPRIGGDSKEVVEPIDSNRTLFLVNLKLALLDLMRDRVSHRLHSNEMMSPEEIRAQFQEGQTG
ncbi:hypothetical protein V1279_007147 [Bradyrhizobium sp. AZCC 1610]|uniref:hypothetical protein n=1 Tax=Bradyrhizobium sp. AZCC 1610 TaxID=3117020 RepID=UPI002FF21325